MKEKTFQQFLIILQESTAEVTQEYFDLPIAGGNPIKRERTYSYELYRIIQNKFKQHSFPYVISAEVDKTGHPIIEASCGSINPEFIIHIPGQMKEDDNLVIVEIKTSSGDLIDGIARI